MLVGSDHHRDSVSRVDLGALFLDSTDRSGSLLETTGADQEPGRFGGKVDQGDQRDRPDPLNGKGDSVCPLVIPGSHGLEHTGGEELPNDPAQIDVGGEVSTEGDGRNLTSIGDDTGLERAPSPATKVVPDREGDLWGQMGYSITWR